MADSTRTSFLARFGEPDTGFALIVEDDGKAAYAYLLQGDRIVGDVWLYNSAAPPNEAEWRDPSKLPFANPSGYVRADRVEPVRDESRIAVSWAFAHDALKEARLFIDGTLWAVLRPRVKPGWCRMAARPGPLAKPLDELASPNADLGQTV